MIVPNIIEKHREQIEHLSKRMKNDEYMRILAMCNSFIFQVFERILGTEIVLVEDDFRLVLDEYKSNVITYELEAGIYSFKGLSEAVFNILQPEYELINISIDIEFDDITMKTKLVRKSGIVAIRFVEKSSFSTILGFKPYWYYKHYKEYISQKIGNLSTTNKIHLKCDVSDCSLVDALR